MNKVIWVMFALFLGSCSGIKETYINCSNARTQIVGEAGNTYLKYTYSEVKGVWGKPSRIYIEPPYGVKVAVWNGNNILDTTCGNVKIELRFRETDHGTIQFNRSVKNEIMENHYVSSLKCICN